MRILGALSVRGAADVIELAVRHNLAALDALVVVVADAADGGADILAALAAEGLPVSIRHEPDPLAGTDALAARALREAFAAGDPDWVIALDAADFLTPPSRATLEAALGRPGTADTATFSRRLRIPAFGPPAADPVAALAAARQVDPPAGTAPGVAHARRPVGAATSAARAVDPALVTITTVPVRSREQLVADVTVAYLSALAVGAPAAAGTWLDSIYGEIRSGRALTPDFVAAAAVNAGAPRATWRDLRDLPRVVSPWLAAVACRHPPARAPFPLAQVLALGEHLARTEAARAAAHLLHGKDAAAALAGRGPARQGGNAG